MILVHRLRGGSLFLNGDLIRSVEAVPETLLTLVDGRTYLVEEEPEEVVDRFRRFRASVIAAVDEMQVLDRAPLLSLPQARPGE